MKAFARFCAVAALVVLPLPKAAAQSPPAPAVSKVEEELPVWSPYGAARVIRNIPYAAHPAPRQNFDLFLPRDKAAGPYPLIFWIHGGAWMMGFKDWDNVKYLVQHGYAIASTDYRLSTEARFPAQIQDCNLALNYVLAHAADYGIDPGKLIIGGASAGGHLALLLGLARHERAFDADPAVQPLAILDFFGPADFNRMTDDLKSIHSQKGLDLMVDANSKLFGAPVDQKPEQARVASPMTYITSASAPVLILQGGRDDLVPLAQSERLHEALDSAGVKNELIVVHSAGHDGPLFSTPAIETKLVRFLNGILRHPKPGN